MSLLKRLAEDRVAKGPMPAAERRERLSATYDRIRILQAQGKAFEPYATAALTFLQQADTALVGGTYEDWKAKRGMEATAQIVAAQTGELMGPALMREIEEVFAKPVDKEADEGAWG